MEHDTEARLERLERRVAALEAPTAADERDGGEPAAASHEDPLWVLAGLDARATGDAVVLAGSTTTPAGRLRWQYGRPTPAVTGADWAASADAFAALGHPVRLAMLQAAHGGAATVAELTRDAGGGSTGQAYHHLGQLVSSGWLRARARGRYEIPAERVVPLLACLLAAGAA